MYLNTKLEEFDGNINVAFIGCGKFISMFLSQYNQLKKIKIDTIIDLKINQAKKNCLNSGLSEDTINKINFVNSVDEVLDRDIKIFIEATGNPIIGFPVASINILISLSMVSSSELTKLILFIVSLDNPLFKQFFFA